MIRKAVLAAALSLGLAVGGVIPPSAGAAMFHDYKEVPRAQAYAVWSSCGAVAIGEPCAYTAVTVVETFELAGEDSNGKQECVVVLAIRGIKGESGDLPSDREPFDEINGSGCGVGRVNVPSSLTRGEVRAEVPVQDCHIVPRIEATCVATTLPLALDWRPIGEVTRVPGVIYHHSDYAPEARCLWHELPSGYAAATVTGQVGGASPIGELINAQLSVGGVIEHGTVLACFD